MGRVPPLREVGLALMTMVGLPLILLWGIGVVLILTGEMQSVALMRMQKPGVPQRPTQYITV